MSDAPLFEARFEQQLRAYAAAGAPAFGREQVARAVATGVASRRNRRIAWPWTRTDSQRWTMLPQLAIAAILVLFAAVGFAIWLDRNNDEVLPGVTPSTSESPAPSTLTPEPRRGFIAFAADPSAGDSLTDPVEYGTVETRPNPMDIYVTREGEPTRRIIATDAHERCPVFSPDGHRLAYLEVPPGERPDPSIVVVPLDAAGNPGAAELRILLPVDEAYRVKLDYGVPCPKWSPDGTRIAYLAYPLSNTQNLTQDVAELRVSTLDGQEQVLNPDLPAYFQGPFAWSPDGDAIAYTRADGVWRAPLDGGAPILAWQPADGKPTSVSWSSRGELAVTVLTEVALEDGGSQDVSIVHILNLDAGTERSLETDEVAWSPDGSRITFVDHSGHILLSDGPDGSTTAMSPPSVDGQEVLFRDVAWSKDGGSLLALARSSVLGLALVSLSTDGASVDVITPWSWAMDWINLDHVSWQPIASTASPEPAPTATAAHPTVSATPTGAPDSLPSGTPQATPDRVKGWPGNHGGGPGIYSWDGSTCEPTNCVMGVLHNHVSNTVRITIDRIAERTITDAGATPITVAGHEGLYLRINPRLEEWNVDFDGTLMSISVSAEAGASDPDVDEAHSIIESLVYEQRDTPLGFRLAFRLVSGDWDSPF